MREGERNTNNIHCRGEQSLLYIATLRSNSIKKPSLRAVVMGRVRRFESLFAFGRWFKPTQVNAREDDERRSLTILCRRRRLSFRSSFVVIGCRFCRSLLGDFGGRACKSRHLICALGAKPFSFRNSLQGRVKAAKMVWVVALEDA